MVAAVLPSIVVYLHLSPLSFGVIDGSVPRRRPRVVRLRRRVRGQPGSRRHKEVAGTGPLLPSPLVPRPGSSVVGSAWTAFAGVVLDRPASARGIRTAPRDAMISLSMARARTWFDRLGCPHPPWDTAGACRPAARLRPAHRGLLPMATTRSSSPAFVRRADRLGHPDPLFVETRPGRVRGRRRAPRTLALVPWRGWFGALRVRATSFLLVGRGAGSRHHERRFPLPHLATAFRFPGRVFPWLLYVATCVRLACFLALPAGRLADRVGRGSRLRRRLRAACCWSTRRFCLPSVGERAEVVGLRGVVRCVLRRHRRRVLWRWRARSLPEAPCARADWACWTSGDEPWARLVASILFGFLWSVGRGSRLPSVGIHGRTGDRDRSSTTATLVLRKGAAARCPAYRDLMSIVRRTVDEGRYVSRNRRKRPAIARRSSRGWLLRFLLCSPPGVGPPSPAARRVGGGARWRRPGGG